MEMDIIGIIVIITRPGDTQPPTGQSTNRTVRTCAHSVGEKIQYTYTILTLIRNGYGHTAGTIIILFYITLLPV